jgi:hypoxanthine phosphoribosyltransferase
VQLPTQRILKKVIRSDFELLIAPDAIARKVIATAQALNERYGDEELTIVMLLKGALFLVADLMRHLKMPCVLEMVRASSYGARGVKRGELTLSGVDQINSQDKHLLLIDDIFDSGETLSQAALQLQRQNPKSLRSLVLLSKRIERKTNYYPDDVLFDIENCFVIGYGLDYKEHYRNLPAIYVYKES